MNKGREWNVPLCTLISSNNPVTSYGEVVHVIEYQAYEAAVKALKGQSCGCYQTESDHIPCQRCEALKELGEHE